MGELVGSELDMMAFVMCAMTRNKGESDESLRARLTERVRNPPKTQREHMAKDGTFTFDVVLTPTPNRAPLPADLVGRFRRDAKSALERFSPEKAVAGAEAYLDCADRLEAALKAQAEAIKATAAPLKKPAAKPKKK